MWPLDLFTYSLWEVQTQLHSISGRGQQSVLTEPLSSCLLKLEEHMMQVSWCGGWLRRNRQPGPTVPRRYKGRSLSHAGQMWQVPQLGLSKDLHFLTHVFSPSQSPASELGDRICLSNKRLRQKRSELPNSRLKFLSLPHYRTETFLWPLQRDLKAVVFVPE